MRASFWSFYRLDTGLLTGAGFGGPDTLLAAATPAGCGAAPGQLDPMRQKIDLASGQPIAYQPPAPPDTAQVTWSWDPVGLAWVSAPTPAAQLAAAKTVYENAAQALLDATAQSWSYDSIISAASYANSGVPQFKAEALALIGWRDAVWQAAYALEAAVVKGTQALPASTTAFLALLPSAPARPTGN